MTTSSSFARISAQPRLGGLLALACLLQPARLPGLRHERGADKPQWKREDDCSGKENFYSKADFCSKALAGSGDM